MPALKQSAFKAKSAKSSSVKTKIDITPLNMKTVTPSTVTAGRSADLTAALEDIKKTEKKATPPKARRG